MDHDRQEELGNNPVMSLLSKIGGWPVLEGSNWKPGNFSVSETLISMNEMGQYQSLFFYIYVGHQDEDDKEIRIAVSFISLQGRS